MYQNIPQIYSSLTSTFGELPDNVTPTDIVGSIETLPQEDKLFVEKHWGLIPNTTSVGLAQMQTEQVSYFALRQKRMEIHQRLFESAVSHSRKGQV